MFAKKYLLAVTLTAMVFLFMNADFCEATGVRINNEIAITGSDGDFQPAWKNYLFALEAARNALVTNDFATAKNHFDKLKQAYQGVYDTDIPKPARKAVKKALKYTKKLIKAYEHRDRDNIKTNLDHIKDALARVEEIRKTRGGR